MRDAKRIFDLTIIVPVKNMEGQLGKLMGWLPEADKLSIETIVVCNGCVDKTYEILAGFTEKLSLNNTVVLNSEVVGPGRARNLGISIAKGRYLAFWDADDSGLVEAMSELIRNKTNEFDLMVCRYKQVFNDRQIVVQNWSSSELGNLFELGLNPGVWRIIFNRKILQNCEFGSSVMGEDQVFLAQVLAKNPNILFSDEILYEYHTGSETQLTANRMNLTGIPESLTQILKVLDTCRDDLSLVVRIMFVRQIITLLYKGTFKLKIRAVYFLLIFMFQGEKDRTLAKNVLKRVKLFIVLTVKVAK
jgi:glycosyltransferase involved in cell wall biosynthesis